MSVDVVAVPYIVPKWLVVDGHMLGGQCQDTVGHYFIV